MSISKFKTSCIIDDDPIHQFGLKILMDRANFSQEILVFENGEEALNGLSERLKEGKELPAVIFLDLNMPIKDGWGFLDEFVTIPNINTDKVTIYIVSSSINPADIEKAKTYEMVSNYIVKPLGIDQLEAIIESL